MTETVVEIRMMAEADIPVLLEIQAVCYTEVTPESDESLHAKLRASQSTCFIASHKGAAVGYLIALPWECSNPPALNAESCRLPLSPDCLYLHDLAVAPGARKSGAARALVEAFLARLRDLGLGCASLVAVQSSAPYWERYGFRVVPPSAPLEARLATYGKRVAYMVLAAQTTT
jgi:ribosomal protein S18 acetylase RimI-like enzyme